MFIYDLFEAPIGHLDTVGEFSPRSSFEPRDQRLIQNPEHLKKIEHAFRHTKEVIDVFFVPFRGKINDVLAHAERHGGVWDRAAVEKRLVGRAFPPPSTPEAITLILTNNEGANRVALTPWIIAHRMGHAIAARENNDMGPMVNLWYAIDDVVGMIADAFDVRKLDVIYAIATMASARHQRLNGTMEIVFECFAQYLITGDIKFIRFTDPMTLGNFTRPNFADEANRDLSALETLLKRRIDRLLADLRGKAVVL